MNRIIKAKYTLGNGPKNEFQVIENLKLKLRTKDREITAWEQEKIGEEIRQKSAQINIASLNKVKQY